MEFTIGKKRVGLSNKKVVETLKGLQPEHLRGRARYYVELDEALLAPETDDYVKSVLDP
jgi:hypothetical protein